MAIWVNLNVRMTSRQDMDMREKMGIDKEAETTTNMIVADLNKVCSYSPFYDENGDADPGVSEVMFDWGGGMVVEMPFKELDKLIKSKTNG